MPSYFTKGLRFSIEACAAIFRPLLTFRFRHMARFDSPFVPNSQGGESNFRWVIAFSFIILSLTFHRSETVFAQSKDDISPLANLPAPTLLNPSNGATNVSVPVNFSWAAVSGASSYRIMIATSATALPTDPTSSTCSCVINDTPASNSYSASGLAAGTTYFWEVHGRSTTLFGDWSAKNSFTIANPDSILPTISAFSVNPSSIGLGDSFPISYTISDSGGSGLNRADLWRAPDSGGVPGSWALIRTNSHSGNGPVSSSFTDSPPSVGTYWYGLHAIDNAGNVRIEPNPPGPIRVTVSGNLPAPTSLNPSNGAMNVSLPVTFSWNPVNGASSYRIMIATSAAALPTDPTSSTCACLINDTPVGNSYPAAGLSAGTTYFWEVHARSATLFGDWSSKNSFTTTAAISDTTAPTISSFGVSPGNIRLGDSFTITYTISDSGGSGLNRAELYRAPDSGGVPGTWSGLKANSHSGNGPVSSSFSDSPSAAGTYWYGLHAIDNAGNLRTEPNPPGPIRVTVTVSSNLPAPTLLSPGNGATNVSLPVTFSWNPVNGASSYRIMVATSAAALPTDPTSTTCACVINDTPVGNSYPAAGLSAGTTYFWEVHARSATLFGDWSSKNGFTTGSFSSPTLTGSLSPPNPVVGVTSAVLLGTATPGAVVTDNETWPDKSTHTYTMVANSSGNWSSSAYLVPQLGTFTDVLHDSISGASKTITYSGQGDFGASLNTSTRTVTAGQSTTYTVTFTSLGGFAGTVIPVALNWSKVPAANAYWTPSQVNLASNGSAASTFTIQTGSATTAGTYGNIILLGENGSLSRGASPTVNLIVNGASASPSSISGVVYSSGAIVDADVVIGPYSAKSGVNGFYSISNVKSGDYVATVTHSGFVGTAENVTVPANTSVTRNFQLQPTTSAVTVLNISTRYPGLKFFLDKVSHLVTFTANIDWGGHPPGNVTFITPNASYEVITNSNSASKSFDMGSEFGVCGKLRVRATSRDGVASTIKDANFVIMQSPPYVPLSATRLIDIGDDFHYEQPSEFNLTFNVPQMTKSIGSIPKPVPFFGEQRLAVSFDPSFKSTLMSDGTINYGVNLTVTNKLSLDVAGKQFLASARAVDFKLTPTFNAIGKFSAATCGWSNWSGGIGFDADVFVHQKYRIPQTLWLVYVDGGAGVRGSALARIFNLNPLSLDPTISDLSLTPYVKGTIGAGVDLIASVEGSLRGEAKWTIYPQQNLVFSAIGEYKITSEIFFIEKEHKVFQCDYTLGGGTRGCDWVGFGSSSAHPTFASRDYLNLPGYAKFNGGKSPRLGAASVENPAATARTSTASIESSVFPFSDPSVSSGGTNLYLSWLSDSSSRTIANRSIAMFSAWNGSSWNDPKPISDDGTADFHPHIVAFSNGSALAAWENAGQVVPDNATTDQMMSTVEIATSFFDTQSKTWIKTQRITNNTFLDRSPTLSAANSNDAMLVWISNQHNDLRGDAANPNTLWSAHWDGTAWSTPQVIGMMSNAILKYDLRYNGSEANLILVVDTDNDPTTDSDHELYRAHFQNGVWESIVRITVDAVPDENPHIAVDSTGRNILVWLKGDQVFSAIDLDMTKGNPIANPGSSTNIGDFKVASSPSKGIAIVWPETSATSDSELQAIFFDPVIGVWGNKEQLTSDQLLKQHLAVAFDGANNLIAVYDGSDISSQSSRQASSRTANASSVNATPITTDLYMLTHPIAGDLAIDPNSLTSSPPNPRMGDTVALSATVLNAGDFAIASVPVNFYQGDPSSGGSLIGSVNASDLAPGDSKQVSLPWTPVVTNSPYSIYVIVDPSQSLNDANRSNNVVSKQFIKPDLAIQGVRSERRSANLMLVTARVANTGSLPSVLTDALLNLNTPAGPVLSSAALPALSADQSVDVTFQWDVTGLSAAQYDFAITVDSSNLVDEYDETNNSSTGTAQVNMGALVINQLSVAVGRTSGGQPLTLTGAFPGLSSVTMGGVAAPFVYTNGPNDPSKITITTPPHAVGAVQIDLTPTSGIAFSKANAFAYLPTVFTDDSLVVNVTTVRAQHVIELRQAVDALRAVAGLGPAPWVDPLLAPTSTTIKAVHIQELRTYFEDAATRLGYPTQPYTDPGLTTGFSIKRVHIEELRQRIKAVAG
jgi:hypothetical protein